MTIPFRQIPSNLREPLFYGEVDASHANTAQPNLRALLIGSKTAAGIAAANVPLISQGVTDAKTQCGVGSILAQMTAAYRRGDAFGEVWYLPLSDAVGGVAAAGSIAFTGPSTAAGALSLYIAGELVSVAVASGTTAAQLATTTAAAINANVDLPVTAAVDGVITTQVNITAKNAGVVGNDIDIRVNYQGTASGEALPAGMTAVIVAMANGATNPTLITALANLQDLPFEFIAMAYTDATSLTAMRAFLNDAVGRWSWQTQLFGRCLIAYRATFGGATTFGGTLNDQHLSALPMNDTPTPMWEVAAALAAQTAISVRSDQAQPIRNVVLQGVLAPPVASRFSLSQRNTLLFDGMSTFGVDQSGQVILHKLITTYQTNGFGSPDNSYLDAETLFNLAGVLRRLKAIVDTKYARSKLAADGTFLQPGSDIVTPNIIRADIIAEYREMEALGWVQQADLFAQGLVVEKDAQNPNRVNVLFPAILIDRLDVFALLAQFRLA
jgi:phage tail sheath gpL-like